MKHRTGRTIAGTIIAGLLAGTLIAAEGEADKGNGHGKNFPGAGELQAFKAKQQKERQEYFNARHEENEAFRESIKDKAPAEALPLIINNRKTQYAATKTFMTGLYTDFVAYAKEVFAKHEVPADKQEAFLKTMQERHDEMEGKHAEMHAKLIAALEELQGKEGLTMEDIKKAIEANQPGPHGGKHGRGHERREGPDAGGKKAE